MSCDVAIVAPPTTPRFSTSPASGAIAASFGSTISGLEAAILFGDSAGTSAGRSIFGSGTEMVSGLGDNSGATTTSGVDASAAVVAGVGGTAVVGTVEVLAGRTARDFR